MSIAIAIYTLLLSVLAATGAIAQSNTPAKPAKVPKQYTGTFASVPIENPTQGISPEILTPATPQDLRRLPVTPQAGARVFFGAKNFYVREGGQLVAKKRIPLAVIASSDSVILYASMSGDTIFKAEDRYLLKEMPSTGAVKAKAGDRDVWLQMPLPGGSIVQTYPIHFIWSPERLADMVSRGMGIKGVGPLTLNSGLLWESTQLLQGEVDIDGTKVLVQYSIDPLTGSVSGAGNYGVDANGDGKIDSRSTAEWVYRRNPEDPLVFRVGEDIYFSPMSVDNVKRQFTLVERTAADYTVIVMAVGNEIPDFNFIDINGGKRKFSEFKGKYVLLDFWSLSCGPCLAEFPHLSAAYEKYKPRGFEILGLDQDTDLEMVKKFLVSKNATWTQTSTAAPEMGAQLEGFIKNTLRVTAMPTTILVGPDGKILSTNNKGELPLRGKALMQTLDKLLAP